MQIWQHAVHLIPCDPKQLVAALSQLEPEGWDLCSLIQVAVQGQPHLDASGILQGSQPVAMFQLVLKRPKPELPPVAEVTKNLLDSVEG